MVINPADLFDDIQIYKETNDNHYRLIFPAIDFDEKDTVHTLYEFFDDHLIYCNQELCGGRNVVSIGKICNITFGMRMEENSKTIGKELMFLHYPDGDFEYTAGFYEVRIDLDEMLKVTFEPGVNIHNLVESISSKTSQLIAISIIMTMQIAAVLSKNHVDPEFYEHYVTDRDYGIDQFKPNPYMSWLEAFFGEVYTDEIAEDKENGDIGYIDIKPMVNTIVEKMVEPGGYGPGLLLSNFPLYTANLKNDIVSEEDLQAMFDYHGKPKSKSDILELLGHDPITVPKEEKPTVFDFVNGIINDQEGY